MRASLPLVAMVVGCAFVTFGCRADGRGTRGGTDSGPVVLDGGTSPDAGSAHCGNGVRDGDETHLDCGGSCMPCEPGQMCSLPQDCTTGVCAGGYCLMPSCMDGIQNGTEVGPDCGGGSCPGCPADTPCTAGEDCLSGVCDPSTMTCTFDSCVDGVRNSDETDVDCGGSCPGCRGGLMCLVPEDCESFICEVGRCTTPACNDRIQNGTESAIDCGGDTCPGCAEGATCNTGSDCESLSCGMTGLCVAPGCGDAIQNGDETDVDCGGGTCMPCTTGEMCLVAEDCEDGVCDATAMTCSAPSCTDGVTNGGETDIDCGGMTMCPRCADFRRCTDPSDCTTAACTMGRCGTTGCIPFTGTSTDSFGYFGCTIPAASPVPCPDIRSTGTALNPSDDDSDVVPIGFSFSFYGTAYTNATVQSNGTITFHGSYHSLSNVCLPVSTTTPDRYIATMWDDLDPLPGGNVWYETRGTAPNRQLIVQWDVYRFSSTPNRAVFMAVLHETTNDIDVCYPDPLFGTATYDRGANATVGIQGPSSVGPITGLQFSCNTPSVTDNLWIQYLHP